MCVLTARITCLCGVVVIIVRILCTYTGLHARRVTRLCNGGPLVWLPMGSVHYWRKVCMSSRRRTELELENVVDSSDDADLCSYATSSP